jgi:hypothetical protein
MDRGKADWEQCGTRDVEVVEQTYELVSLPRMRRGLEHHLDPTSEGTVNASEVRSQCSGYSIKASYVSIRDLDSAVAWYLNRRQLHHHGTFLCHQSMTPLFEGDKNRNIDRPIVVVI